MSVLKSEKHWVEILKFIGLKTPNALIVICGMSTVAYQRPDGVIVVPITALKN